MDMLSLNGLLKILEEIEDFHIRRSMKRWSVAIRQAINRLSEPLVPKPEGDNTEPEIPKEIK